jgi:hypothetical protein
MTNYSNITKCRGCSSDDLTEVLFLGDHPLANALKGSRDEVERKYPLTLMFCAGCSLVQIKETVSKETLFSHYVWVTGTSATAQRFADDFYDNVCRVVDLKSDDLVIEIASNDGTFLKPFIRNNRRAIGVDPATNVAQIANETGVTTVNAFWSVELSRKLVSEHGTARFVFARNVIPHVSELHDVLSGIELCLAEDGIGAIEFHYAGRIHEQLQYDAIYHEHLCYFSIKSIEHLLKMHNLRPFHLDLSPISGGALVIYFTKAHLPLSAPYSGLSEEETRLRIDDLSSWKEFASKCVLHREKAKKMMNSFPRERIVGFGASARSSTFLNFCEFTGSNLDAVIDNNSIKQGCFTPGSSIPIVSITDGLAMEPWLIFVLAWNFKDEIILECRKRGYREKFLVPFPNEPYLT